MNLSSKMSKKKFFIGIDLHSTQFTCFFLSEGDEKFTAKFPVNEKGIRDFINLAGENGIAMVEASTGTFEFVSRLKNHLAEIYVANTHKLKLISMVKRKTDKVDAEKLAIFLKMQILGKEELIRPVYVPEKKIQELRSLFTTYKLFTQNTVQIKNRIHSIYKQNLIIIPKKYLSAKTKRIEFLKEFQLPDSTQVQVNVLLLQLSQTEENILEIEKQIKITGVEYYREIEILTSMKGISILMAIAILADIADIKRFSNSKHLTSYLRSAPSVDNSNEIIKNGRTNKFGRKLSISFIAQSVLHFLNANPYLYNWYTEKSKAKGKGKMRMAIIRKVFSQIFHMLSKGEYHRYRDKKNHSLKMNWYNNFLKKNGIKFMEAA